MLKAQADGVSVSLFHQRNLISAKMKIETKFGYYDKCYTMLDNKVYSFEIERIDITITPVHVGAKYTGLNRDIFYYDYQCKNRFSECDCYASKEELLASL